MSEHLRFSPDILSRLGEELVPDIDQGIVELAKNSYDADATFCKIALTKINQPGGVIRISDDGVGMTEAAIRGGWLVIGKSGKLEKEITPIFGRIPVGDKGLGRLAALRLGSRVRLATRPSASPGKEHRVEINWEDFASADVVEDVPINIETVKTADGPGTDIEILDLASPLGRGTVDRLARSLVLLSDPFVQADGSAGAGIEGDPGFSAVLLSDDFADLQKKVRDSYFADAEYRVHAEIDSHGRGAFSIMDWKGDALHETTSETHYACPPLEFDLWVFILDGKTFSTRSSTLGEVRDWLKNVGGVHIYEDGIRVPPYGGAGNDWLELNLRRSKSPENRPSTNTSVGRVRFSNIRRSLQQKTDRVGYIENNAFLEVKRSCGDALDWAARVLTRERDKARQAEKEAARRQTERGAAKLENVLDKAVRVTDRRKVDNAIARFVKDAERETRSLKEELQLYRSLATAGMSSAVFAHEIGRPLDMIEMGITALKRMIPKEKQEAAERRIGLISAAKVRLNSFVSIPLTMLAKRKRRSGRVNVNDSISGLLTLLDPIFEYFKVSVEVDLTKQYSDINGSEALIEGVCLNLIMNSINAFQRESFSQPSRRLSVETAYDGSSVIIVLKDNAGGIDGVELDDIWLPGVTTSPDGTGFGLTIVRDSIADLGGAISALPKGDFGGAEFTIRLPPMRRLTE